MYTMVIVRKSYQPMPSLVLNLQCYRWLVAGESRHANFHMTLAVTTALSDCLSCSLFVGANNGGDFQEHGSQITAVYMIHQGTGTFDQP